MITDWLAQHEGWEGYLVLGMSALIEYVLPPFPGDTVALFGVFLACAAGWSPVLVYFALNGGAIAGGMATYAFGRLMADPAHRPRLLRSPQIERTIAEVRVRFERHGAAYLMVNRFVPALRAFFFVGAGLAGLPWPAVLIWGGLSALLWNGLLLGIGWWLGNQWDRILALFRAYSRTVLTGIALVAVLWAIRAIWARRPTTRRGSEAGEAVDRSAKAGQSVEEPSEMRDP
jgi:membrane-associated protein